MSITSISAAITAAISPAVTPWPLDGFGGFGGGEPAGTKYAAIRLVISSNMGDYDYVTVNELKLSNSAGPVVIDSVDAYSSLSASYLGSAMIDGVTTSQWLPTNPWPKPATLTFTLAAPSVVDTVSIFAHDYASGYGTSRAPRDFEVHGSTDGTNFTLIKAFTNTTWGEVFRDFSLIV